MEEDVGVEISSEQDIAVMAFTVASISDFEKIAKIAKKVGQFIEEQRPAKIIFDFEGVKFFSSQVLGLLIDMRSKLQAYNGEVVVSAINPQLYRIFKITNLDKIFRFFPDRQSAVDTVGAD